MRQYGVNDDAMAFEPNMGWDEEFKAVFLLDGEDGDRTPPKLRILGAELSPLLWLSSRFDLHDHLNQSGD